MIIESGYFAGTTSWTEVVRNWLYSDLEPRRAELPKRLSRATASEDHVERRIAERTRELEGVIAQLRARQQQLEAEVNHDSLTGLANRKLLDDRCQCAVQRAQRHVECFGLLMIDLNGFKAINDTHGHAAGDKVLVTVAQRLRATLRTCDTAARIGGDEFVVLVESIHDAQELSDIGRKLVTAIAKHICLENGVSVAVGASVGMAIYPDDGLDISRMLHVADQAMYECKASGFMNL